MTKRGFHTLRDGDTLTVARRLPARFDVVAELAFPPVRRARLAHQIRQDLWRGLRNLRGFSPVVEVTQMPAGCLVRAGGQVDGAVPKNTGLKLVDILGNTENQTRWLTFSRPDSATIGRGVARALRHTDSVD